MRPGTQKKKKATSQKGTLPSARRLNQLNQLNQLNSISVQLVINKLLYMYKCIYVVDYL